MKALLTDTRGRLWLEDVPLPEIGEYDCLVRMEACLFCHSTDRHIVEGTFPCAFPNPSILGHEGIGVVESAGAKVTCLKAGERVLRPFAIYPDEMQGACGSAWGGFAEYGKVRDWRSMVQDGLLAADSVPPFFRYMQQVPADIPLEKALLMITQKEIFSAQRKISDVAGKNVLIAGAGITACLFGLFLRQRGAHVTMAARRAEALDRARSLGAVDEVRPLGDAGRLPSSCDALIDTTGNTAVIRALVETALRPGAPVYCYAVYVEQTKDAFFAELSATRTVQRVDPAEATAHDEIVTMIRQGRLDPTPFISGYFRLSEYQEAWESVIGGKGLKAGIFFGA